MQDLKNKTIGVFFGGQNPEHEVSIITGEFAIAELQKMGHQVVAIYIDKNGKWYSGEELSKLKFFQEKFENKLDKSFEYNLNLNKSQKKLVLENKSFLKTKEIVIDFIFPTFHGLGGEDGTIQGLAEFFQVPYAGCGIYTSSVAIDKVLTKKLLKSIKIPTTDFLAYSKTEWQNNSDKIIKKIEEKLTFPIFVKPARSGSSIGISKVKKVGNLKEALDLGFHYDTRIIVENGVENIADLTCAVLSDGKEIIISEIQEALFEDDLFDYSVKYLEDGGAQTGNAETNLVIPAEIEDEFTEQIKRYSKIIFKELEGNGTARVDFLLNKETGELFANEINTLPGTFYHHLWKKSNISIQEVLKRMLEDGFLRWQNNQKINVDFESDVLTNANSLKLQM